MSRSEKTSPEPSLTSSDAERLVTLAREYRRLCLPVPVLVRNRPDEFSPEDWALIRDNIQAFQGLVGQRAMGATFRLDRVPWLSALRTHLAPQMIQYGWTKFNPNTVAEFAIRMLAVQQGLVPESELRPVRVNRIKGRRRSKVLNLMRNWK